MKKKDLYARFYPKSRSGNECRKVECVRHESYKKWDCGDSNLKFCMECKHAHISQYKRATLNGPA